MIKGPDYYYSKNERILGASSCSLIMIVASICYTMHPISDDWMNYLATSFGGLMGIAGLYGSYRLWKQPDDETDPEKEVES
jgi:hypothetical protein